MPGYRRRPRGLAVLLTLAFGVVVLIALATPERAHALVARGTSSGCGPPAPAAPPSSLMVDGRARGFITVIPANYRPGHAYALVLAFHGRTSPNTEVREYYHLEDYGPDDTIYVYPSGLRHPSGGFTWWDKGDPPEALRDFALFDALVATFERQYCIDRGRIYAVGHSLGASFVNALGCARGDVLRAIGTLAGGMQGTHCRGKVAAAIFHNPADRLVAFDSGLGVRNFYIAQNDDRDGPDLDRLQSFTCARYGPSEGPYPVVWCPHNRDLRRGRYYPHQWPADAGVAIMRFFDQLPESRPIAGRVILAVAEHGASLPSEASGVPLPALRPRFIGPSPLKPTLVAHQPALKPANATQVAFRAETSD